MDNASQAGYRKTPNARTLTLTAGTPRRYAQYVGECGSRVSKQKIPPARCTFFLAEGFGR